MTIQLEEAFSLNLPSWKLVHQGENTGVLFSKGELRIKLMSYKNESIGTVSRMGQTFFKIKGSYTTEEALLSVKEYLDKAFPGMS